MVVPDRVDDVPVERFEWIAEQLDDVADERRYRAARRAAAEYVEVDPFEGPRISSYFDELDEDRDWRADVGQ